MKEELEAYLKDLDDRIKFWTFFLMVLGVSMMLLYKVKG